MLCPFAFYQSKIHCRASILDVKKNTNGHHQLGTVVDEPRGVKRVREKSEKNSQLLNTKNAGNATDRERTKERAFAAFQ